jgi:hypothetical protein
VNLDNSTDSSVAATQTQESINSDGDQDHSHPKTTAVISSRRCPTLRGAPALDRTIAMLTSAEIPKSSTFTLHAGF